jgi:hypothetical protein
MPEQYIMRVDDDSQRVYCPAYQTKAGDWRMPTLARPTNLEQLDGTNIWAAIIILDGDVILLYSVHDGKDE